MTGLTKFMSSVADGTAGGKEIRKDALREEFKGIVIDTCDTTDCGWETGIEVKGNAWVIVEEYPNKEEAIKGHKKWVKSLKENPTQELKDCRSAEDWAFGY